MEQARRLLSSIGKIRVDLSLNKVQVNPIITYAIFLLGLKETVKCLYKLYMCLLFPAFRRIFHLVFKDRHALLSINNVEKHKEKWVIVYGSTTHVGKLAARIFAKYGYSLILVDNNLNKL